MNSNNNIIKIEARHEFTLFPRYPIILGKEDNNYGVVKWSVLNALEGEPITDKNDCVTITGSYDEEIDGIKTYTILAKETEHPQHGKQYQLIFIGEILNLSNVGNQKAFLKTFLTNGQIEEMFKVLKNPLEAIQNHDIESLKKVHGIGDYISEAIIMRYEKSKDYCNVYLELDGLGLTPNFIQRLIKRYNNPNKIIKIVKENPYQLSFDIEGIGFKTADKIALSNGMDAKSPERIKAYINYLLNELGERGNSFITAGELTAYIFEEFDGMDNIVEVYIDEEENKNTNIGVAIEELQNKKIIIVEKHEKKTQRRIYLKKYWDLENKVANELKRIGNAKNKFEFIDWQDVVRNQELKQGWKFTSEQREGIEECLNEQLVFITGEGGCVDCDTEYFNGTEWVKISDYKNNDKVLQYNKDGSSELVNPLEYHKYPSEYLWHFETKYGLDQCLSDEHNVYYITSKNNLYHKTFKEVRENHEKAGFKGRFITTFNYEGKGLPYSEWEIRLKVAIKADGSFSSFNPSICYINVKKQRKKDRIEYLLKKNNIEYDLVKGTEGYKRYKFTYLDNEKTFTDKWYSCSKEQFEIIYDEIFYWDGRFKEKNEWFTSIKSDADFIQFVGVVCGYKSTIQIQDRLNQEYKTAGKIYTRKSIDYKVCFTKRNLIGLCIDKRDKSTKTPILKYKTIDGFKYCFTVSSGMLILRRNNKIFVTGNSGKSSVLTGALQALRCYEGKYSFTQCALAGRAGARMQEITGEEGSTIHRLLGFKPGKGFRFNRKNKLPYDIIILDEISLVGGEIFLSLIEAIKTGAKLIVLGDLGQLESIGCMNLAKDLYYSDFIKTIELTEIHRQAKKSGIIVGAHSVRKGEQIFDNDFTGKLTIGELQDMHFSIHQDKDKVREDVIEHFKNYWNGNIINDIMDIQVLVPVKERGDACVFNLNSDIQEIYNPQNKNKLELKIKVDKDKIFTLRTGDKVMNLKNNYKLFNTKGEETFVYNGWIGIIETINTWNNSATIYFPIVNDRIIFDYTTLKDNVILGYVSTIHKFEGSSSKIIIGAIDYSTPPDMRTKELVYTLLTRAEIECALIGQAKAINDAIHRSGVSHKQTFLVELLDVA